MSWRLVVADGVVPDPGALEALHAARARVPDAVVLAAKVVLPDGSLDPGSEPWPRILDKDAAIDAAREGLVAVRAAPPGALLVRDAIAPTLASTAAALAGRGRGYLVPAAVARRQTPSPAVSRRERLRLLRAPHWSREERLWQLFMLARAQPRRSA